MIIDKNNLLYVNEHTGCESYDHERQGSLAEILKTENGRVYERESSELELVFILEGQLFLSTKDSSHFLIRKNEFTILPSGTQLRMEAAESGSAFFCKIIREIDFCDILKLEGFLQYTRRMEGGCATLSLCPPISRFLDSFIPCLRDQLRCKHYIALKVSEFLILLRTYYPKEQVAAFFRPILSSDQLFRNFAYKNALTGKSVTELARLSHMSVNGFLHRFKRLFGCTPSEYISREKAKNIRYDLLCSNLPIKEISERYGFGAVPTFNDFCKKALGKTPGQIRMGA